MWDKVQETSDEAILFMANIQIHRQWETEERWSAYDTGTIYHVEFSYIDPVNGVRVNDGMERPEMPIRPDHLKQYVIGLYLQKRGSVRKAYLLKCFHEDLYTMTREEMQELIKLLIK